ncbi:hypothetical protein KAR91_45780 [Candidatus Pacearchaeota archaeon]|nr:hypothetical protein [Candidatus Pacearchaeota archaeon]
MKKTKGYQHGGLRLKYQIIKTSGKPVDPKAKYFVLRYDEDPHAVRAIMRYIASIKNENPELAKDLLNEIGRKEPGNYPFLNHIQGFDSRDAHLYLKLSTELKQ